jgi:hypothetical protein
VNHSAIAPLVWNGQSARDEIQAPGFLECDEPKKGTEGGEARISRAGAIAALLLQVVEESEKVRGVQIV